MPNIDQTLQQIKFTPDFFLSVYWSKDKGATSTPGEKMIQIKNEGKLNKFNEPVIGASNLKKL